MCIRDSSHIAEVLNRTSIVSTLWLNDNPIGDQGLQTIYGALKQNNSLKHVYIGNCGMTDTGVDSLADALHTNNTLETLYIYGNDALTENGLICLVDALRFSRNSRLVKLWLPKHLMSIVEKTISETRKRSGLAAIEVWGKSSIYSSNTWNTQAYIVFHVLNTKHFYYVDCPWGKTKNS